MTVLREERSLWRAQSRLKMGAAGPEQPKEGDEGAVTASARALYID